MLSVLVASGQSFRGGNQIGRVKGIKASVSERQESAGKDSPDRDQVKINQSQDFGNESLTKSMVH